MSAKAYSITYSDGSVKRVYAHEKEQLLLRGAVKPTSNPYRFKVIERPLVFKTFGDMGVALLPKMLSPEMLRRYLGLCLIFELLGERTTENELTPEGLALKLANMGAA